MFGETAGSVELATWGSCGGWSGGTGEEGFRWEDMRFDGLMIAME
jgi:hypothetical protein